MVLNPCPNDIIWDEEVVLQEKDTQKELKFNELYSFLCENAFMMVNKYPCCFFADTPDGLKRVL